MNAINLARQAYAPAHSPLRTSRSTEHQVFGTVTARLRDALLSGPVAFCQLAAALHDNRALWTCLAAEVADDANALPVPLRAQIFYLCEFTAVHTSRVLRGEASAQALIDINTAIMRGLSTMPLSREVP